MEKVVGMTNVGAKLCSLLCSLSQLLLEFTFRKNYPTPTFYVKIIVTLLNKINLHYAL